MKYNRLFEKVLSESAQIEKIERMIKARLHKNLEKASLDNAYKLKDLIIKNPEVRKIVVTIPIYEQPKYKKLFRPEIWVDPRARRYTLFSLIMDTINDENFISYWVIDSDIIGFVSYQELEGNIADGIKIFEFNKSNSNNMQTDTLKFVDDIIDTHKITKWEALTVNEKAVKSYDIYLKKKERKGFKILRNEESSAIYYSVINENFIQK